MSLLPCTPACAKGEILGLTWKGVDFARGMLQLEHTKSGRRREVPMSRAVRDALDGLLGLKAEGFVFRKRDGRAWGNIRAQPEGSPGDPRAPGVNDDAPVLPPESGSAARCRRQPRGVQHKISTRC